MTKEVKVNASGTNEAIKYHVLPDKEMRELGFIDRNVNGVFDYWVAWWPVPGLRYVSLYIRVPKKASTRCLEITTIDGEFLQPFDWQAGIGSSKARLYCKDFSEQKIKELQEAGLLSGHEYGDYI